MVWPSGRRRPADRVWEMVKRQVRIRSGGQCEQIAHGVRCTRVARDVDHVIPFSLGGKPILSNAQHLCIADHKVKTQREANEAARLVRDKGKRAQEIHPFDVT